jgi:hypothetical protein
MLNDFSFKKLIAGIDFMVTSGYRFRDKAQGSTAAFATCPDFRMSRGACTERQMKQLLPLY